MSEPEATQDDVATLSDEEIETRTQGTPQAFTDDTGDDAGSDDAGDDAGSDDAGSDDSGDDSAA